MKEMINYLLSKDFIPNEDNTEWKLKNIVVYSNCWIAIDNVGRNYHTPQEVINKIKSIL